MPLSFSDYLIDQQGIDWSGALSSWSWLLPADFTLWLVNRFGDLFIVLADDTVHMLDVGAGTLTKVAESRDDFADRMNVDDNAAQWLMIPLVDFLVHAGKRLEPGQCYGFATPPALGGAYAVENCAPISMTDYLGACGSIHGQIKDLPDGARVVLKVSEEPP